MYPRGLIYKSGFGKRGEVHLRPTQAIKFAYGLLKNAGAGLVGFAVIALVFTLGAPVKEEIGYRLGNKNNFEHLLRLAEADRISEIQQEAKQLGVDSYFSLVIPKIDAKSKVVANVSTTNEREYRGALQDGVAHAKGTHFPGQGKKIFLFAHSTDSPLTFSRYNAVFYLLNKLEKGDTIVIFFADKKYIYEVQDKVIASANDVSWYEEKGEGEVLVLQTCFPPGTTLNRLLVSAKPLN